MLKWIIKRNPPSGHMFVEGKPWGVYLGGFRDSSHESAWLAQQRINELIEQEARWLAKMKLTSMSTSKI